MRQFSISCIVAATTAVALGWTGWSVPAASQTRMLCVHDIEPPNSLGVHASPNGTSPVVARFPAKSCGIKITGDCSGSWCQVSFDNRTGWVDHKFMAYYDVPAGFKADAIAQAVTPVAPESTNAVAERSRTRKSQAQKIAEQKSEPKPNHPAKKQRQVAARSEKPALARGSKPRHIAAAQSRHREARVVRREWSHGPSTYPYGFGSSLSSALGSTVRMFLGGPAWVSPYIARPIQADLASTSCVRGVQHGDVLYVRSGPGVSNAAVDGIPPGACGVARAGVCHGTWCRVSWRGRAGWVNRYYLN